MQAVGDYTLGPLLGKGGMSEVYAASHPALGHRLALKLLRDDADGAFHVEAAARAVVHPNVMRVLDAGQDADTHRYFLVMERIDGDLASLLARGRMTESAARTLFAAVADGMAAVHEHGIVHRDLKPANVMLDDGEPRIADFGIAKVLGENAALVTSRRIGTLGYMAPEQFVGGMIAPSVDVWALGVMMFEAVTGALPFAGFTSSYTPQLVETAPRTATLATVTPAYDEIVARCLDGDPANRPTMTWLASVLRGEVAVAVTDERVTRDAGVVEPQVVAPPRRRNVLAFVLAGIAVLSVVGTIAALSSSPDAPAPVAPPPPRTIEVPVVEVAPPPSPPPVVEPPRAEPPVRKKETARKKPPRRDTARRETLD